MGKNDYIAHGKAHLSKNWDAQKQSEYMKNYYRTHPEKWRAIEKTSNEANQERSLADKHYKNTVTLAEGINKSYNGKNSGENRRKRLEEPWKDSYTKYEEHDYNARNLENEEKNLKQEAEKDANSVKGHVETAVRLKKEKISNSVKRGGDILSNILKKFNK